MTARIFHAPYYTQRLKKAIQRRLRLSPAGPVTGIAQANTFRQNRNLWALIERSLWIKEYINAFCEDYLDVSRPSCATTETYTDIFDSVLKEKAGGIDEKFLKQKHI